MGKHGVKRLLLVVLCCVFHSSVSFHLFLHLTLISEVREISLELVFLLDWRLLVINSLLFKKKHTSPFGFWEQVREINSQETLTGEHCPQGQLVHHLLTDQNCFLQVLSVVG